MRAATRLLARVKPQRLLEPGNPTGLTGLFTHPSPRSTLLYYYNSTLDKLKQIPESSVYRQSTEALTKQRLSIVEKVKPEGYDAWQQRMSQHVEARTETLVHQGLAVRRQAGKGVYVQINPQQDVDEREQEWDGEETEEFQEGPKSPVEAKKLAKSIEAHREDDALRVEDAMAYIEPEPRWSLEQVQQLENELAAGLIEEVIQVAEGEHQLVDKMIEAKVWEELEEPAPEGQWTYFERAPAHTSTQKP